MYACLFRSNIIHYYNNFDITIEMSMNKCKPAVMFHWRAAEYTITQALRTGQQIAGTGRGTGGPHRCPQQRKAYCCISTIYI